MGKEGVYLGSSQYVKHCTAEGKQEFNPPGNVVTRTKYLQVCFSQHISFFLLPSFSPCDQRAGHLNPLSSQLDYLRSTSKNSD